jgi:hypothetical protein
MLLSRGLPPNYTTAKQKQKLKEPPLLTSSVLTCSALFGFSKFAKAVVRLVGHILLKMFVQNSFFIGRHAS